MRGWCKDCTAIFLFCAVIFAPFFSAAAEKKIDSPVARKRAQAVAAAALDFQRLATADYQDALARYASPAVKANFQHFDKSVWQTFDPAMGWAFFFTFSPYTMGAVASDSPLVAFYQPWCDVFLITQWETGALGARMVDAELIVGDLLRTGEDDEFSLTPLWMRIEGYRPLAFMTSLVSSLTSFEAHFRPDFKGAWRKEFPLLGIEDTVELNRLLSGNLIIRHIQHAVTSAVPTLGEDERLPAIRKEIESMQAAAGNRYVRRWFASVPEMSDNALDALENLDGRRLSRTIIASVLMTPGRALVFLVPRDRAGFTLALLFEGGAGKLRLQRADLMGYQEAYHSLVTAASEAEARAK